MATKEMSGKLPVELGFRFAAAIRSRGICPGSRIETLPDLGVILHRVQQLEHQIFGPSGSIGQ